MKKRSILISMLVIGVVAALIAAATTATFSDQVTSTGNTFTAGTLYMSVDGKCDRTTGTGSTTDPGTNWSSSAGNLGTDSSSATNSGGLDATNHVPCDTGVLTFDPSRATGSNPDCAHMAPGDSCTGTFDINNKGSLDGTLYVTPTINGLTTGCTDADWHLVIGTNTAVVSGTETEIDTLAASDTLSPELGVELDDDAGNPCQGVPVTVDLAFRLVQS